MAQKSNGKKSKNKTGSNKGADTRQASFDKNLAIEAGAGCGKTTRVVERINDGLRQQVFPIDRIAVITFTRKAASDLKSRTSISLQERLSTEAEWVDEQLKNMGNARISTIHSFAESLLKERPVEADVDPGFTVVDEREQGEFFNETYSAWLAEKLEQEPDFFRTLHLDHGVELKTKKKAYSNKDPSLQGLLRTALAHRELELYEPRKPEALSKQLKAFASDCREFRKEANPFTAALKEFMDEFIDKVADGPGEDLETFLADLKGTYKTRCGGPKAKPLRDAWKPCCEAHLTSLTYVLEYPEIKWIHEHAARLVKEFIGHYREVMRKQGVMDFDEILFKTERLLATNKDVRSYFKQKFTHLFVDEFQDTDPLQMRILFYLAEEPSSAADTWDKVVLEPGKLCVVGDPKQSIYRFRRADIEMYTQATEKIIQGKGGTQDFLKVNYRSSSPLIDWVNALFRDRIQRPDDGAYQADYIPLKPRDNAPSHGGVEFVEPKIHADEALDIDKQNKEDAREMEARLTAAWILQNAGSEADGKPYRYRDIMVLFRTGTNMRQTAQYLEELEIPCELVGSTSYFGRAEVVDMGNLLHTLANPLDQVCLTAVLKGPFFSLTDRDLFDWKESKGRFDYRMAAPATSNCPVNRALVELKELHQQSRETTAYDILARLLEAKGILASYMVAFRGQQKVLNVIKSLELLKSFGRIPFTDAATRFVEKLEAGAEMPDYAPRTGNTDAIQLMTIHKAKGLEARVVYLADSTSDNLMGNSVIVDQARGKIVYNLTGHHVPEFEEWKAWDTKREAAEAERVRYVVATRAKERFVINRVPSGALADTFAAPFFDAVDQAQRTVLLDIGNITLTPGRSATRPAPKVSATLEQEQIHIHEEVPAKIEQLAIPSLPVQSPSTAPTTETDLKINIIYGDEDPGFQVEPAQAALVGTLAHKLLEANPKDLTTAAATLIKNEKASIQPDQLVEVVQSLQHKALQARIDKAVNNNVLREVPVKFKDQDGIYYDGTIDLLFEEEDGWVLADYKAVTVSGEETEEHVKKKYSQQLALYAEGLEKVGLKVKETLLVAR